MTVLFSQTRAIKLKVVPRFPSLLLDGIGTEVVKQSGNYQINLDYSRFGITNTLPPDPLYTLIWDSLTGTYILTPLSVASGGIGEAPIDGTVYGRINAGWVRVGTSAFLLIAGHQTTTGGFCFTSYNIGTISSGTVTPNAMNGNYQYLTNTGAFTLAAPGVDCAIDMLMINGAGAGAVTFSGFTVGSTGDALTTTSGNKFIISVRQIAGVATYLVKALQ